MTGIDDLEFLDDLSLDTSVSIEAVVSPFPRRPALYYGDFLYDAYDWTRYSGPDAVIKLTKGYFMFVERRHLRVITQHSWCASVRKDGEGRILRIYAVAQVNGRMEYAHRLIAKAGRGVIVDHFNGLTLDNRLRKNLRATNYSGNIVNAVRFSRTTHAGLPRGVECRGDKYGGQIKCHGVTFRSKNHWKTPGPAHRWYLAEYKKLYKHRCPTDENRKKDYPIFPPRLDGCPF